MEEKEKNNPKEKIELSSNETKAVLSTDGSCLQKFSVADQDILFPETLIEIEGERKKRGGMPILFPWAGFLKNYPQHGFARNLEWERLTISHDLSKTRTILELKDNKETRQIFPYHFYAQIKMEIKDKKFLYLLTVFNQDQKAMPLCPGLHPYFKVPQGEFENLETSIKGFSPKKYKLTETLFFPLQSVDLRIPQVGEIKMNFGHDFSRQQARLAVWTDNQDYLCIEPWSAPLGGFLNEKEKLNLPSGHRADFSLSLNFYPDNQS